MWASSGLQALKPGCCWGGEKEGRGREREGREERGRGGPGSKGKDEGLFSCGLSPGPTGNLPETLHGDGARCTQAAASLRPAPAQAVLAHVCLGTPPSRPEHAGCGPAWGVGPRQLGQVSGLLAGGRAQTPDKAGSGAAGRPGLCPRKELGFGGERVGAASGSSRRLQEPGAPRLSLPPHPPTPSSPADSWLSPGWLPPCSDFLGCLLPWGEGCSWLPRIAELWRPGWGPFAKAVSCLLPAPLHPSPSLPSPPTVVWAWPILE